MAQPATVAQLVDVVAHARQFLDAVPAAVASQYNVAGREVSITRSWLGLGDDVEVARQLASVYDLVPTP